MAVSSSKARLLTKTPSQTNVQFISEPSQTLKPDRDNSIQTEASSKISQDVSRTVDTFKAKLKIKDVMSSTDTISVPEESTQSASEAIDSIQPSVNPKDSYQPIDHNSMPKIRRAEKLSAPKPLKKNVVEGNFKKTTELDLIKLLNPELLQAIKRCGLIHPSAIQKQCLPIACIGEDLICQAKSGTGKTLVYVLSTLQQVCPKDGKVSALIMCTTRELAMQIGKEFKELLNFIPNLEVGVFFGGVPVENDKRILEENCPHIVIGTPGRIQDLLSSESLPLQNLKHFILDECDKMLENLDMRQDVQQVYVKTPRNKQVMMFSATFNDKIKAVCRKFMKNPKEICIEDDSKLALGNLQQFFISLEEPQKNRKLIELLDFVKPWLDQNRVFIFVKSVARCDALASFLASKNYGANPIHGGMAQDERTAIYKQFESLPGRILVATKVFGRGMDIVDGNIVINYDMPEETDDYLHRVGRQGRAGRFETQAVAFTFITTGPDEFSLKQVQDRFKLKILPFTGDEDFSFLGK